MLRRLSLPLTDTLYLSFLFGARLICHSSWAGCWPRLCDSAEAMSLVYNAESRQSPAGERHYLKMSVAFPLSLVHTFIRFRTGCHNSPSLTGRSSGLPRHLRKCLHRASDAICDDHHLDFKCLALADLRHGYSCLLGEHALTLLLFVWQENTLQVKEFVQRSIACFTVETGA